MNILITGCAGFIGFHLSKALMVNTGNLVVGIDNLNEYYDIELKKARLGILEQELKINGQNQFVFYKYDLTEEEAIDAVVKKHGIEVIFNLAAQAGVRYSIEHPGEYFKSNMAGFFSLLEVCRKNKIRHFYFASSSSIYGNEKEIPYREDFKTEEPISFYAATKKSNELMAYSYHKIYGLNATGLRFFTVYGPWGRPDMAYFSFTNNILKGNEIKVFNNGNLMRDFTFIDDVVQSMRLLFEKDLQEPETGYRIFNIGNSNPVKLFDFISTLETLLHKKANIKFLPMQMGDVEITYADTSRLESLIGYKPMINIREGLAEFVDWYLKFYFKTLPDCK